MSISKNITDNRKKRGLTQKQLAERIGVSQESIFEWENGLETPSSADLKNLESALSCLPGTLFDSSITSNLVTPSPASLTWKTDFTLEKYLHEGEKVFWSGKQGDNPRWSSDSYFQGVFFLILVLSSSVLQFYQGYKEIWKSLLVGIAIFTSILSFIQTIKLKKITTKPGTLFALTSSRIVIVPFDPKESVRDMSVEAITNLRFTKEAKKRGTIDFNPPKTYFGQTFRMAFVDIEEAKQVMTLINEQRDLKKLNKQ